jgi:hypothetical protein
MHRQGSSFSIEVYSASSPFIPGQSTTTKSYHNVGSLTLKVIVLTLSSFYFGYTLPELSSFRTNTV